MRRKVQGLAGLVLVLASFGARILGAVEPPDVVVGVDPRALPTRVSAAVLLQSFPPGSTIVSNSNVLRGTISQEAQTGDFLFTPTGDFWTLGTDRFSFTVQYPATGETEIGLVMLAGLTAGVFDSKEEFGDAVLGQNWEIYQDMGVAAIGNGNLTILGDILSPNEAEANVNRDSFATAVRGLSQGGKVVGGGGSPPPQPPPPPGGLVEAPWHFKFMSGVGPNDSEPFWVELRPTAAGDDIRLAWLDPNNVTCVSEKCYGDWHAVGSSPHDYELNWWETVAPNTQPQVMLWVDGRLVDQQVVPQVAAVDKFAMGVLSRHPVTGPGLTLDDISLWSWGYASDSPVPRAVVHVVKTFEDGTTHPLDLSGATSLSTTNPLVGTRDMVFDAVGQTAKAEYSNTGDRDKRSWNARFRLRFDGLQIPANASVTVVEAFSLTTQTPSIRLELRKNGGNTHQLRLVLRQDTGPEVATPWEHAPPAGGNIEVQWWTPRSSFETGGARLWINTVMRQELRGIENRDQAIDGFRMGLISPPASISGFARIDTIQTWSNE